MTTQATHATQAVGVDIGGTGIKGALVDLEAGTLLSERVKVATPTGAEPDDVLTAVQTVLDTLGVTDADIPLGVAFPAIVKHGRTLSAANVADTWIGFEPRSSSKTVSVARSTSPTTPTSPASPRRSTAPRAVSRASCS